jgi:hypothetical protein
MGCLIETAAAQLKRVPMATVEKGAAAVSGAVL